jgi:hypothetical protein
MVLKIDKDFFIIEAKHIKEEGGAQNKQLIEIIDFINYSETSESIHYLSFIDGGYFSKSVSKTSHHNNKLNKQKKDIVKRLETHPNNFFVNTMGLEELLKDISCKKQRTEEKEIE